MNRWPLHFTTTSVACIARHQTGTFWPIVLTIAFCVSCIGSPRLALAATIISNPYVPARSRLPDGTVVSNLPGGASVTRKTNGTSTTKVRGTTFMLFPDGTTFTELPGGGSITTKPDGQTTTRLPDGTRISRGADGKITTQLPLGGRVTTAPGGTKYIEHPDGTRVEIFPNGGTKTKKAGDGTEIFTKADGTTTIFWLGFVGGVTSFQTQLNNGRWRAVIYFDGITNRDLRTITVDADGSITTELWNGSKFTTYPDGHQTTVPRTPNPNTATPPGLQVTPLQQQRPAVGTVVIPGPAKPGTTITKPAGPTKPGGVPLTPSPQKTPGAGGS